MAALQTEYSLIERVAKNQLLDTYQELGIALNSNHLSENIGAWTVKFTAKELTDFRTELSKIKIEGVR